MASSADTSSSTPARPAAPAGVMGGDGPRSKDEIAACHSHATEPMDKKADRAMCAWLQEPFAENVKGYITDKSFTSMSSADQEASARTFCRLIGEGTLPDKVIDQAIPTVDNPMTRSHFVIAAGASFCPEVLAQVIGSQLDKRDAQPSTTSQPAAPNEQTTTEECPNWVDTTTGVYVSDDGTETYSVGTGHSCHKATDAD